MLGKRTRRSGMLALVLALALAGTAPSAALGFDFAGWNPDGWSVVWSWLSGLFGADDEGTGGKSGGPKAVYDREGAALEPNGEPTPTEPSPEEGAGLEPNGSK